MNRFLSASGRLLSRIIQREVRRLPPRSTIDARTIAKILKPGDVILVDGIQNVSVAIKYLTQSSWSHAAMYVGEAEITSGAQEREPAVIEVDLDKGCQIIPLSRYANFNIRICRPHGLTDDDCMKVVGFMRSHLGIKYDLKNVIDLARYLIPTPPVPVRWRRRMIALGSGDPTRAICSSLIAQAFQSIHYPILPTVVKGQGPVGGSSGYSEEEIYHIRHHSLFAPRDFDLSPYFTIIKPTIVAGFDFRTFVWAETQVLDAIPVKDQVSGNYGKS